MVCFKMEAIKFSRDLPQPRHFFKIGTICSPKFFPSRAVPYDRGNGISIISDLPCNGYNNHNDMGTVCIGSFPYAGLTLAQNLL